MAGSSECTEALTVSSLALSWEEKTKTQTVTVTNGSNKKRACKLKCSDNKLYMVNPVFFVLEPQGTQVVTFTTAQKITKSDKFLLLHCKTEAATAQEAFAALKKDDKEISTVTITSVQSDPEQKSWTPTVPLTPI